MTNPRRFFFLLLVLGSVCLGSLIAQPPAPSSSNDIAARIEQLKEPEKNIPENQIELSDELRRIDDELARRRAELAKHDVTNNELDGVKSSAAKLFHDIDSLDCTKVGGTVPEAANLGEIASQIVKLIPTSSEPNPWATMTAGSSNQKLAPAAQCQALKDAIGDANKRQSLLGFIDNRRKESEAGKAQLNSLVEALQKRRGALLQHVSAATAQTKVGDDIWLIILILGLLCVLTIVAVRFFDRDIQFEWVSSGQVIQFVTVMILLTVIMALGLAGILKENTLGTLLGGVAGYVLSQGVGKAAASAVQRGMAIGAAAIGTGTGGVPPLGGAPPAAPPAITALSAVTGAPGTPVTITGTGFAPNATVAFGGASAAPTSQTDSKIDVKAPAGSGTVDVVVTNPDKQSAKAPKQFVYS